MEIKFKFYWEDKIWGPWNLDDISSFDPGQDEARIVFQGYKLPFTNLRDKNGKEIYRGHIVEYIDYSDGIVIMGGDQPKNRGVIIWGEEGQWKISNKKGHYINTDKCEVIGNNFQDEHLLEETKQ